MATEVKVCGVCSKNDAAREWGECSFLICEMCAKVVLLQDLSPGTMVKPGVSLSPLRAGQTKKKVCPKCLAEVDFM